MSLDLIAKHIAAVAPQATGDLRYVLNDRGQKWPAGTSGSGRLAISHTGTRRKARESMQDSPLARAMVERIADTVADNGLRLELEPVIEVLGITREAAAAWARDVMARFDLWCRDKRQHRSETLTFYQFQRLYQICQHRDNDIFVRLFYDADPSLQNPLQFEALDPDQIRGDAYTTTYGPQGGVDGILRDERGRETGYKIWYRTQEGEILSADIPQRDRSRIYMLHGFRPEYAGQGRGYSRLAHAIQEFENITDFSASVIKKAINQSQIVGFVEPSKEEDAQDPFEGLMTDQGAGPAAEMFGSQTLAADGIPVVPERPGITATYQVPEVTMDTPGSMFITNLTRGSKIAFSPNSAPADSYDKFVDAFATYVSASTGIPLEVVLMRFGQNYSASRATLLLFWRIAVGWRYEMDSDLLSPVVEMWLAGEIAAGRIVAPGWSDPRLRAAWLNKNWIGSPAPDIDPNKTANARRLNIETGVTNLEREAREFNGSSAATNLEVNRPLFANFPLSPWKTVGGQQPLDDKDDDNG